MKTNCCQPDCGQIHKRISVRYPTTPPQSTKSIGHRWWWTFILRKWFFPIPGWPFVFIHQNLSICGNSLQSKSRIQVYNLKQTFASEPWEGRFPAAQSNVASCAICGSWIKVVKIRNFVSPTHTHSFDSSPEWFSRRKKTRAMKWIAYLIAFTTSG